MSTPGLHTTVTRMWQRRGPLALLFTPLSLLFYLLWWVRRLIWRTGLCRPETLPVPVIVVGNLVAGGSGKTPLVLWLFDALRAAGMHPGIISRGYGGTGSAHGMLVDAATPAQQGGDEPCLLAQRTGQTLAIGRDRVAAARRLLQHLPECNVLISDDGLQHLRLPRQFEIVVFDRRGAGNGWLLPAGPLREPLARLQQIDALVCNGCSSAAMTGLKEQVLPPQFQMQLQAQAAWQLLAPSQQRPLASFVHQNILAAAGIGDPARFFAMLTAQGLPCETLALPDHYAFADNPFAGHPAEIILITEKDAVKCSTLADPRIWVVPVRAEINSEIAAVQNTAASAVSLVSLLIEKLNSD